MSMTLSLFYLKLRTYNMEYMLAWSSFTKYFLVIIDWSHSDFDIRALLKKIEWTKKNNPPRQNITLWICLPVSESQVPPPLHWHSTHCLKAPKFREFSLLYPEAHFSQNCPWYPVGHAHCSTQGAREPVLGRAETKMTLLRYPGTKRTKSDSRDYSREEIVTKLDNGIWIVSNRK